MTDFHIDFGEEYLDDIELEIGDIEAETDVALLIEWYQRAEELIAEISDDIAFKRSIDRATDTWLWRAGRKIAYLKKGVRSLEQRILRLGGTPPYPLNDGRANQIRTLERKIAQAKDALLANGIPLPWEKVRPARDSDASLAEDAKRLSPEGVAARAEGIAPNPSEILRREA